MYVADAGGVAPGDSAEDDTFQEGVASQPVRTVYSAGDFSRGQETFKRLTHKLIVHLGLKRVLLLEETAESTDHFVNLEPSHGVVDGRGHQGGIDGLVLGEGHREDVFVKGILELYVWPLLAPPSSWSPRSRSRCRRSKFSPKWRCPFRRLGQRQPRCQISKHMGLVKISVADTPKNFLTTW